MAQEEFLSQNSSAGDPDQRLVDIVIYLASLTSQPREIDPMLDTLRKITADWKKPAPLPPQDREALGELIKKLKDYLINRDSLRDFTAETLEARLEANFNPAAQNPRFVLDFGNTIALACAASAAVFLGAFTWSMETRLVLMAPTFLLVCILGTIWFYLSSLTNFKPALRRAFAFFCSGTVLLGIFFTHFVAVLILGWGNKPLFRYGGVLIIATAAVATMYLGLRVYAHLLGLKTRFASVPVLASVLLAAGATATLVASYVRTTDPSFFYFSYSSLLLLTTFAFFGSGLARIIFHSLTATYAVSIRWLAIFMTGTFIGSIAYGLLMITLKQLSGSALSAALAFFAVPPVLLLLYSGYSFKRETGR